MLGVAPVPALSSSGTLGKPLNISRNRSDHHNGFYFLKNSIELLPRDWPYGCHLLVTFIHFLHTWVHKVYISPWRGHLYPQGTIWFWVLSFTFLCPHQLIWDDSLYGVIPSLCHGSVARICPHSLLLSHIHIMKPPISLQLSMLPRVAGGQNPSPRCFFRASVLPCSATCKADDCLSIVAQWGPHRFSFCA